MSRMILSLAAGFCFLAAPVLAHHTAGVYDEEKVLAVQATVKELQWGNPRVRLAVSFTDAQGRAKEADLELASPAFLMRQGWTPKLLAPGDKVKVDFHPHKDDGKTGFLLKVTLPSGKTLASN